MSTSPAFLDLEAAATPAAFAPPSPSSPDGKAEPLGGEDVGYDPIASHLDPAAPAATSSINRRSVALRWDSLGMTVPLKDKTILTDVSGEVLPGQMLAIMGSSGAGKTTLLNLLAGRLTSSKGCETSGRVLVNGAKRNFDVYKKISAYVEQDDNMFASLTVQEQIEFSAMLRLPNTMPRQEKRARAEAIIQELGLSKVRDSFVGNEMVRGVSGGERKRVNVGTELVTDPSLIFLDEPTSGLDSFNALNVMYSLRNLASNNRTVITTIHQPRSNIFGLFDNLCLLSEGRVMYFGPAADAVTYFAGLNYACPPRFNPADYFIDLLSIDPRDPQKEQQAKNRVQRIGDEHDKLQKPLLLASGDDVVKADIEPESKNQSKYSASWMSEVAEVGRRSAKLMRRDKLALSARIGQDVVFSVLLGLIWLNEGRDVDNTTASFAQINGIVGVIFFIIVNGAFKAAFGVIFAFPSERAVLLRERASATYRVSSYSVGKTLSEAPRTVLFILFFSTVVYFMVGLKQTAGAFFFFYLVLLLIDEIATSLTLTAATLSPNPQVSSAVVPVFIIMNMLFGGFFIANDSMPVFLRWVKWLSFCFYGLQALVQNEFSGTPALDEVDGYMGIYLTQWAAVGALVAYLALMKVSWYVALRLVKPKFDKSL